MDAIILVQTAVRMNMKMPIFKLFPFVSPSSIRASDTMYVPQEVFSAREMTRVLKPSLKKWARLRGVHYFVEYSRRGGESSYIGAKIKFSHEKTKWDEFSILRTNVNSYFYQVMDG